MVLRAYRGSLSDTHMIRFIGLCCLLHGTELKISKMGCWVNGGAERPSDDGAFVSVVYL